MHLDTVPSPGDRESAADDVPCDLQPSLTQPLADIQVR